jgi:hypothetical protein
MNGMRRKYIFPCLLISACLLTAPAAAPSLAAQLGDIPVMEEFAAGLRAIAAMDPDENIRNPDTMAHQFLTPAFWFWTALDEDYEQSKKFIKYYRVSAYYTQNACTKHIDGILLGLPATALNRWSSSVPGWTAGPTASNSSCRPSDYSKWICRQP